MSNGYGGSSGSTGSTGGSTSSGSYSSGQGFSGGFVKIKNGIEAPLGFHYMPNGKLMNDADHIAEFGYIERTISGVDIDYRDIRSSGESRSINIIGDPGFVFSMDVYEGDRASYYNFKTNTWSATKYCLTNVQAGSGSYSAQVSFPVESSLKTYTINIYAETVENIKTKHVVGSIVKNADGSVNLNASNGSDSGVLTKVIYQDVLKNLYLSAISPMQGNYTDTVNGAVSNSNKIIIDGDATDTSRIRIGDLVTGTGIAASVGALVTEINPDNDNIHEFKISVADSIGDGVVITFTTAFTEMTPHYTDSNTGRAVLQIPSAASTTLNFSITLATGEGRAFRVDRLPTAEDLCVVSLVTFGANPLAIPGESTAEVDVKGIETTVHYRWPVNNVANLSNGMSLDPSNSAGGGKNTIPAKIKDYKTTTTLQRINKSRYNQDADDYTVTDVYVPGVDATGAVTGIDRNGRVTAQAGNIAFSVPQMNVLKADTNVKIIAQGVEAVKTATGIGVSLSNIAITPVQSQATTTASSSASTTIALDQVKDVVVGATVRNVDINNALENPTVVSKSVATGAGNIVVSSAQTLEDDAVLFFDGTSAELNLTGTINVSNMPITDTVLYFNVERFLTAL